MDQELETAGAASVGALKSDGAADKVEDGVCRNCGRAVDQRYCAACGQLATDFHRPVLTLLWEALSDSFALDGRIARTLPALMLHPGRVTRAYLDGQRARFVPPFRLFLLASLAFFGLLFFLGGQLGWTDGVRVQPQADGGFQFVFGGEVLVEGEDRPDFIRADGTIDETLLRERLADEAGPDTSDMDEAELDRATHYMVMGYRHQDEFLNAVEDWLPRLSLLLFPFFALTLTLLYCWRRSVYVYDHLITTLHFQAWFYLASVVTMGLAYVLTPSVWYLFALTMPIYVFLMLRRVYGDNPFMAIWRTGSLLVTAIFAFVLLLAGVLVLSYLAVAGSEGFPPG